LRENQNRTVKIVVNMCPNFDRSACVVQYRKRFKARNIIPDRPGDVGWFINDSTSQCCSVFEEQQFDVRDFHFFDRRFALTRHTVENNCHPHNRTETSESKKRTKRPNDTRAVEARLRCNGPTQSNSRWKRVSGEGCSCAHH